jgi:transposase
MIAADCPPFSIPALPVPPVGTREPVPIIFKETPLLTLTPGVYLDCYHKTVHPTAPYSKILKCRRAQKMKRYSKEFKGEALALAEEIGVRLASEKLGITQKTLYQWQREKRLMGERTNKSGESDTDKIKRLEKENNELRQANEILKKAMGFFVSR